VAQGVQAVAVVAVLAAVQVAEAAALQAVAAEGGLQVADCVLVRGVQLVAAYCGPGQGDLHYFFVFPV